MALALRHGMASSEGDERKPPMPGHEPIQEPPRPDAPPAIPPQEPPPGDAA